MDYHWISGRAAVAYAESIDASRRLPYLKQARVHIRHLHRGRTQLTIALGTALHAAIQNLTPGSDRKEVLALLERAVAIAEVSGGLVLAEAARRWLGEMIGGRRGEEIRARSNGWMADQGVQNPARLAHLFAPGFRRNGN